MITDELTLVYVFAHVSPEGDLTSPVKVGITRDVEARLSNIQTACPHKIELAYCFQFPTRYLARGVEMSIHKNQKHKRTHGEWFDITPRLAIGLICMSCRAMAKFHLDLNDDETNEVLDLAGVLHAEEQLRVAQ